MHAPHITRALGCLLLTALACSTTPKPLEPLPQTYPTQPGAPTTEPLDGQIPPGALYTADAVLVTPQGFNGRKMAYLRWHCATCAAPRAPIPLAEATSIAISGVVDLAGEPFVYDHQSTRDTTVLNHTTEAPRLPAALVQFSNLPSEEGHRRSTMLFLVLLPTAERPTPVMAWRHTLSSDLPSGGGFSTINAIAFTRPEGAPEGSPLVIELESTSIPAPGDTPYMPGPPMLERFVLEDGIYVRR